MLIHQDQTPLTQEEQARVVALLTRDGRYHREFIQYCVSQRIQAQDTAQDQAQGLLTVFAALCASE